MTKEGRCLKIETNSTNSKGKHLRHEDNRFAPHIATHFDGKRDGTRTNERLAATSTTDIRQRVCANADVWIFGSSACDVTAIGASRLYAGSGNHAIRVKPTIHRGSRGAARGVVQDALGVLVEAEPIDVAWLQRLPGGVWLNDSSQLRCTRIGRSNGMVAGSRPR